MSNNTIDLDSIFNSLVQDIKKKFTSQQWYDLISSNVKKQINWIFDNFDIIGIQFVDNYIKMFKWECYRRFINKESLLMPDNNVKIQKMKISDELYHCGMLPTKFLLNLEDWEKPNDADVEACIFLCQEILQNKTVIDFMKKNEIKNQPLHEKLDAISSYPFIVKDN